MGNLLVKNEIAASVLPPMPLDWCRAQTQATIGLLIMNAPEAVLASRGLSRRVATLVTRALVDTDDPGSGSMGPKVEAAIRFVEGSGRRAVIISLDLIADAADGQAGTVVECQRAGAAN